MVAVTVDSRDGHGLHRAGALLGALAIPLVLAGGWLVPHGSSGVSSSGRGSKPAQAISASVLAAQPGLAGGSAAPGAPSGYGEWVVEPGDTLWSIAEAVDPNGDVRPLVQRLAAQAGGASLYPGEIVLVPIRS